MRSFSHGHWNKEFVDGIKVFGSEVPEYYQMYYTSEKG